VCCLACSVLVAHGCDQEGTPEREGIAKHNPLNGAAVIFELAHMALLLLMHMHWGLERSLQETRTQTLP
jgi:hypothetical protein